LLQGNAKYIKFNFVVKVFLFIIPFLYYIQVLLMRNDFVPIPYLILFFIILITYYSYPKTWNINGKKEVILLDELIALFIFMNFIWVFYELVVNGYKTGGRVFIYNVVPLFLYFYIRRYLKEEDVNHILLILALTSIVVAGESLYERYFNIILLKSVPFQERNFNYVATIGSGTELIQLKAYWYRAPGMLEHLNATATYIGLGVISSLYFFKKNKIWLIFLIFNCIALVVSGARTALVATLISVILFIYLQKRYLKSENIKRSKFFIAIFVFFSLTVLLALLFYSGILNSTYKLLFSGEGSITVFSFIRDIIPVEINNWYEAIREMPIGMLFGYGPGGTLRNQIRVSSDDFFIIDIVGRYGVIGSFIFYIIFFIFTKEALFSLKKTSSSFKNMNKGIIILSFSVILLLLITTIHSGALARKSIFPWLFVAYGIGRRYLFGIYSPTIKKG